VVPYGPFGFMHTPEITRFIGIKWLACKLYPDRCAINMVEETKKFTKLFMHADITDAEAKDILHEN
jgi:iron complex transport system substrate-binding protein